MKMRVALLAVCAGGLLLAGADPLAAAEGQTKSSTSSPKEGSKTPKTGKTGPSKQSISDQAAAGNLSTFYRTNPGTEGKAK